VRAEAAARTASCETRILLEISRDVREREKDRGMEDWELNVIGR